MGAKMSDEKFLEWARSRFGVKFIDCKHDFSWPHPNGSLSSIYCSHCGQPDSFANMIERLDEAWNACKESLLKEMEDKSSVYEQKAYQEGWNDCLKEYGSGR